jgi:hypothetical protein
MNTTNLIHGSNTSDIRLVAALGAMGITCDESSGSASGAVQTRSGINRVWNLSTVSNCGLWKLKDLQNWWRDRQFHIANPDHPFNRVKCAMASSKAFSECLIHNKGIGQEMRGDSLIARVMDFPVIVKADPTLHKTDDFTKCAAFLAMGIPASEIEPNGSHRMMQIGNLSRSGAQYAALNIAWNDSQFHITNPQHPFSYIKAALWNHRFLVTAIKQDKPLVEISRGESFAYLHPDCSSITEEKILSQFDK